MDLLQVLQNIDWIFAAVLLIGGRYWGARYVRVFKKPDYNFLLFATLFGAIWLAIQNFTGVLTKAQAGNLFLTYLFTTSFYSILARRLFEWIEAKFGQKQTDD